MWVLTFGVALAGQWSGIRPEAVPVVHDPVYATPDSGWTARLDSGGTARVMVAVDSAGAHAWLHDQVTAHDGSPPEYPFGDEAFGNGIGYLLWRDGNVAVVVQTPGVDALDVAIRLRAALEPQTPWPEAPAMTWTGHEVAVDGAWARVSFRAVGPLDPVTLLPANPDVVPTGGGRAEVVGSATRVIATVWDDYGRSVQASWVAPVGTSR